jgi:hypothetical protein
MLPSGNDAAHALAEYFGDLLLQKSVPTKSFNFDNTIFQKDSTHAPEEDKDEETETTEPSTPVSYFEDNPPVLRFIQEMNKHARRLGMESTNYDSPHGLPNKNNVSTAADVARL